MERRGKNENRVENVSRGWRRWNECVSEGKQRAKTNRNKQMNCATLILTIFWFIVQWYKKYRQSKHFCYSLSVDFHRFFLLVSLVGVKFRVLSSLSVPIHAQFVPFLIVFWNLFASKSSLFLSLFLSHLSLNRLPSFHSLLFESHTHILFSFINLFINFLCMFCAFFFLLPLSLMSIVAWNMHLSCHSHRFCYCSNTQSV